MCFFINAKDNTQADWDESDSTKKSYIKNKPTSLPANGGDADTLDGKHANDFTDKTFEFSKSKSIGVFIISPICCIKSATYRKENAGCRRLPAFIMVYIQSCN